MSQYIDPGEAQKSYRPKAGSMSPGLKRAREPYRVKNALMGLALGAFAVGVWAYSISAVKQDIFDDVDEEAQALKSPPAAAVSPSAAAEQAKLEQSTTSSTTTSAGVASASVPSSSTPSESIIVEKARSAAPRGVLQHLNSRLPRLLEPEGKTLVWGAPPVDNVGKISKS